VYTDIEGGGGTELNVRAFFTNNSVTPQVRLNSTVEGRTKLRKTQRISVLFCAVLKVMSYSF
jgi:hypothetical protein